jgi:phosphoenolpyruvate carboxykinase (ATP)
MLGEKIKEYNVNVWLVNTGWIGGKYGKGERISLEYTRAMIKAALEGELNTAHYIRHASFGLMVPSSCSGVPSLLFNPEGTWKNKKAYAKAANTLAGFFTSNFKKYSGLVSKEITWAGPAFINN